VPARINVWAAAPAPSKALFAKVDALIADGKWRSAWDLLAAADTERKDPWNLARSIELVLDGYIDTMGHLSFALMDLPAGTSPGQLRGAGGGQGDIDFEPATLADALAADGAPALPALEKALARYWKEVGALYQGQWAVSDDEIAQRTLAAYAAAREGGAYDAASLAAEAELLLNMNAAAEAEVLLAASAKLDPAVSRTRYSQAVALLMQERSAEALPIIEATLAEDKDPSSRLTALNLAAQASSLAGDKARASAFLDQAEKEAPDSPEPLLFRHYLAVNTGDSPAALAVANRAVERFGADPQLISTVVSTWFQGGDPVTARAFLEAGLASHADNDEAASAFGFYLAVTMIQSGASLEELAAVGPILDDTEARFKRVYPPEHQVFSVVADIRGRLAEAIAAAEEALGPVEGPPVPPEPTAPKP
jgi:tetratricopeptide (TPR) repeat protein